MNKHIWKYDIFNGFVSILSAYVLEMLNQYER